jgi:hypothetical protein
VPNGGDRDLFYSRREGDGDRWQVLNMPRAQAAGGGLDRAPGGCPESGAGDGLEGVQVGLYTNTAEHVEGRAVGERLRAEYERQPLAP